jgi:hypothetical protein
MKIEPNNDYLWDRTGEPDPQIQELEEELGALRYQPQPLELPAGVRTEPRRRFLPGLAIAATIALMALALGLWLSLHRVQTVTTAKQSAIQKQGGEQPASVVSPTPGLSDEVAVVHKKKAGSPIRHRNPAASTAWARNQKQLPKASTAKDETVKTQSDEEYAAAAKDQLILALRLASAKLNFAQRKTQGSPAPGTIRNQHKIG